MRVHRGPSCSPREPRTVCSYKQDLTCALGAHERNREAPACAGKNSATLRPLPRRVGNFARNGGFAIPSRARGLSARRSCPRDRSAHLDLALSCPRTDARPPRTRPRLRVGLFHPSVGMTLWTFCQSVLLTFNAFAILNEPRFLEKYGLGQSSLTSGYVSSTSPRGQLIGLITATQYMRGASDPPPPPPSVRSSPPGSLVTLSPRAPPSRLTPSSPSRLPARSTPGRAQHPRDLRQDGVRMTRRGFEPTTAASRAARRRRRSNHT